MMGLLRTRSARSALVAAAVFLPMVAAAAPPRVGSRAALVMDAATGAILWGKNPDEKRAPASTTKVLTVLLALESGRLDERFKVSARAQAQAPSKLYLRKGQQISLRDLNYALMLKSANDGAVVVAEGLGGTVEGFAEKMNARARKAGAKASNFRNPNGLPDRQHLSTARDLGLILRAALNTPGFREVVSTSNRSLALETGGKVRKIGVQSKNRLLNGWRVRVIGKTGFTRAAGRCFVGAARLGDGREVIVVTLGAPDLWGDIRKLVEWAQNNGGRAEPETPRLQMASVTKQKAANVAPPAAAPAVGAARAPVPAYARQTTTRAAQPVPPPSRAPRPVLVSARTSPAMASSGPALVPASTRRVAPVPSQPARVQAVPAGPAALALASAGAVRRGCTGRGCEDWLRYGQLSR